MESQEEKDAGSPATVPPQAAFKGSLLVRDGCLVRVGWLVRVVNCGWLVVIGCVFSFGFGTHYLMTFWSHET